MKRFTFVLLALVLGLSSASAEAAVVLRPQTDVNRAAIRLGDVFAGLPEGIDRDIATAPVPGQSVTYDYSILVRLAAQYRLDWQASSTSDHCVLTRAATHITQDMIRAAIETKLREQKSDLRDVGLEVFLDNRNLQIALPADMAPDFTLNRFVYDPEARRFRAELAAGEVSRPVLMPVTGRIIVKRSVPVLAHRLEGGSIIGESDLTWETVLADKLPADMITSPADLIGREVRRDTPEDTPIRSRDVMQPRLVTHGNLATMRIETPFMLVTAQGRALQDGSIGDTVRVMNVQSKRIVEGTVVGTNVVRIDFVQQSASVRADAAKERVLR
jgi:flagella basal body P-ring formation protein FlgA